MIVAVIHRCHGCRAEGRAGHDTENRDLGALPDGWGDVVVLGRAFSLCPRCKLASGQPHVVSVLSEALRFALGLPAVGDEVLLTQDGIRGKCAGMGGVITFVNHDGDRYDVRVPGYTAPGEKEEYVGPYSRSQFELAVPRRST